MNLERRQDNINLMCFNMSLVLAEVCTSNYIKQCTTIRNYVRMSHLNCLIATGAGGGGL